MEFTGERFVPGQSSASIAYEHLARYLMVQPVAAGKRVLDLGSGEGYGAHLLASTASQVLGVDVSWQAVEHATRAYASGMAHLQYVQASATHLPLRPECMDLVVAFEILEHVEEQARLLDEVRRVLRPGGMFLVSTPNKASYSDLPAHANPFHVRELYFNEFSALLEARFGNVSYFAQRNLTGSLVAPIDESGPARLRVKRIRHEHGRFAASDPHPVDHLYYVAACSDSPDVVRDLPGVVLADRDQRLWLETGGGPPRHESAPLDEHGRSDDLRAVAEAVDAAARVAGSLQARAIAAARDMGASLTEAHPDYDILVPVFNAHDALKRCLDSLIANTDHRHTIHVLDDASTDPRVASLMQRYVAKYRHVRHYRLPSNLGFPGTVNAGLASTARDVVLVNSDTEFPPAWLPRLDRCRRSDPRIHAVSPLSNNASICSVPHQNQPNDLPMRLTVEAMDELVQRTSLRRYPRPPTTVGFCMLMSRQAIEEVGPFDMVFGRGYGEEVDWCQRAWAKGYQSAICDDLYVYHAGQGSFAAVGETDWLRQANQRRFEQRWPSFDAALRAYCASNPLRYQQQRILEELRNRVRGVLPVLHVAHAFDQPAGVEMFLRLLIDGMRGEVSTTILYPVPLSPYVDAVVEEEGAGLLTGGVLKVRINARLDSAEHLFRGVSLSLRSERAERLFAEVLTGSGARIVQFDHLANVGSLALPLVARASGAKVIVVLHDHFLLCPDWNLLHASGRACGETRAVSNSIKCLDCLASRIQVAPQAAALDLPAVLSQRAALVRAMLLQADAIVAPSEYLRAQFARAWGNAVADRIRVIGHGTPKYPFTPSYRPAAPLRVAFLGNALHVKGIRTFVQAANSLRSPSFVFTIIGGLFEDSNIAPSDNVWVAGSYVPRELPRLLQEVDVAYIGSLAHEAYCYTLDEAYRAGVPVIASDVGAIPERVRPGETGLLVPPGDAEALVKAIRRLHDDRGELAAMRRHVACIPLRTVEAEVADYVALYRELLQVPDDFRDARQDAARTPTSIIPTVSMSEFLAERGIDPTLPLLEATSVPVTSPPRKAKRR